MNDTERDDLYLRAVALRDELDNEIQRYARLRDLGRADDAADALFVELTERPLCVERIVTYRVTLGTGGPACGVDFDDNMRGRVWWQDWGTPRVYADGSLENGGELASAWGVDMMIEDDEDR